MSMRVNNKSSIYDKETSSGPLTPIYDSNKQPGAFYNEDIKNLS